MQHPTHHIEKFFYNLGALVGRYSKIIIIIILIFTCIGSLGLIFFEETNNVRTEYSPLRAPSQKEYAVVKKFLKQNGTLDPCYVMVSATDKGNLLRNEYRMLLFNLTRTLQTEVVVYKDVPMNSDHDNDKLNQRQKNSKFRLNNNFTKSTQQKAYTFMNLCEPYCQLNSGFLALLTLYDANNPVTHTYPVLELVTANAFIGNNVYGVKLKKKMEDDNDKLEVLESFNTAIILFFMVANYEDTDIMIKWQHKAIKLFKRPEYSSLKIGMTGDNLVSYEVRKMGLETAPLIIGSVILMIIFVVITSFRVNAIESKPWEALIGCFVPLLAMVATMGIMSAFGMRFQSIVVAAIFLVLSVGIDDIFILTRAWHHSSSECSLEERMALTLEDAGPSITISALTNVMSFAIGALSDTPAVQTFCIFSAVAITICYIYQLLFLSAILVYFSEVRERRGYRSVLCCSKANVQAKNNFVVIGERLHARIVKWWASIVTKWSTRILLTIIMIVYFVISYIGISRLQSNISIDKMALPDSYLHDFQSSFETALREMQPISVFVMKPGDLRQPKQLKRVKSLISDFEHSLNAYGSESTILWLSLYEKHLQFYNSFNEDLDDLDTEKPLQFIYNEIPAFFRLNEQHSSFVHMNETACIANQPECITAFFFITNFHDVIKYHELIPTVYDWRRIADNYSDLNVYAYSDHSPFVDQTMSIDQTVFGSVAAALFCMTIICLLFIPHFMSVMAAVFSVFSVSWGIFGLLALWNVDLDPLSMAALLMAIGFSVDFTAHISYHYYKAPYGSSRRRMQIALGIIGWPMIQVGFSTIVALMPLLLKQSYLAIVFFKTIVVVVLLGMFHGLVILPAILTLFNNPLNLASKDSITRLKKKSSRFGSSSVGGTSSTSSVETTSAVLTDSDAYSQRSNERKESFYNTQNLIKKKKNLKGWLHYNRSFFGDADLRNTNGKMWTQQTNKVKPLNFTDLPVIMPETNPKIIPSKTAYVHKIALGRSSSNCL